MLQCLSQNVTFNKMKKQNIESKTESPNDFLDSPVI